MNRNRVALVLYLILAFGYLAVIGMACVAIALWDW